MIIDLRQFDSFPAHLMVEAEPDGMKVDYDSVVAISKAALEIDIQKSGEEFFCQGMARASVRLICARCLEEFDKQLANDTNFIVCSQEQRESHGDVQDNEEYVYFQGSDLQADVSDIVRQSVIMEVALKPLCSEECRGLCPGCGVNLNNKTCDCKTEKVDPRWEALKKLSRLT